MTTMTTMTDIIDMIDSVCEGARCRYDIWNNQLSTKNSLRTKKN